MIAKIIFTSESYKPKTIREFEFYFPSVFICITNQLSKPLTATNTKVTFEWKSTSQN